MKIIPTLFAAAVLTVPAFAQATPDAIVAKDEPIIQHAIYSADDSTLADVMADLDGALAKEPGNPALLYERALADYAKTAAFRARNDKASLDAELDQAQTRLGRVRGEPWQGEAEAMQGDILGELISVRGGMSGMTLGPKSGVMMGRAAKALPESPRVLLFRGVTLLNTPPMYGGDPKGGLEMIKQAVANFENDHGGPGPHWGKAEGYAWLGVAEKMNNDIPAARAALDKAMEVEPGYPWVKFVLMPMLSH